jgi:hypothetical protein
MQHLNAPEEWQLGELHARQQAPEGQAKLRERSAVEHTVAHRGRALTGGACLL